MSFRAIGLIAGVVGLLVLGIPSLAGAATFTVNATGDAGDAAPGDGACKVAGQSTCTLRAAAEEANALSGADGIKFAAAVVNHSISIGSPIPIDARVSINGCSSQSSPTHPCVGVLAATGAGAINLLDVVASNVTVQGLALGGGDQAIFYAADATGLVVQNNWIGMGIGGGANGSSTGITLTGNGAKVGGSTPAERNVIANNGLGIKVFTGSNNKIQGNYLGTAPNGTTPQPNGTALDVEGNGVDTPSGNLIGGAVSSSAASTQACDNVCNVMVGGTGAPVVVLGRPSGAAGSVSLQGNYIGTDVSGTSLPTTPPELIQVLNNAGPVTIGGPSPTTRNLIDGGNVGIGGGGKGLSILGNYIGLRWDGAAALPAVQTELVLASASSGPTVVSGNRLAGNGTRPQNALTLGGTGGKVTGNVFGIGTGGQNLRFASAPVLVQGLDHIVGGSTPAVANIIGGGGSAGTPAGVLLDGASGTTVKGNLIGTDGGGANRGNHGPGVLLQNSATGDVIGGNTASDENTISNATDSAIVVADAGSLGDRFGVNVGKANPALFIDLGNNGFGNAAGGPNSGVQVPTIATASKTAASGTANQNATIRLFLGSAGEPGTVKQFIGQTTAGGGGQWTLTYPSALAAGERVTATQTSAMTHNTSELSPLRPVA